MNIDSIKCLLKKSNLKVTELRCLMLQTLTVQQHLTAEQLFELVKDFMPVSLSSIYRNLIQMEHSGIILKHQFKDNIVYEINEDQHHDHLICNICGVVVEFVDYHIENRQKIIAKENGFKLSSHILNLYGICRDCEYKI